MSSTVHSPMVVDHRTPSRTWATPSWLRTASVALVVMAAVSGIVGVSAVLARQHAAHSAAAAAEPLVVDAETVDVTMSDANTSIAGGFLAGPVVPAATETRFEQDLAQAAAALTAAAQKGGADTELTATLTDLTSGLATYRAAVATAEAANRQGYPVGTAYLAEANSFMRTYLLPSADSLYKVEQSRLTHEDSRATASTWLVVLLILLVVVLGTALWLLFDLARRFRRVVNLGVLVGSVLVVASALWAMLAAGAGDRAISTAEHHGTAPLAVLTQARILAEQIRADDELTLVTRDSDASYQSDLTGVASSLSKLLETSGAGWTATERADLGSASQAWSSYQVDHNQVRSDDGSGQLTLALTRDQKSAADSASVDTSLGTGVTGAVQAFESGANAASDDLSGLAWGLAILMIVAALAVVAGVEPRIREYR